MNRRFATSHVLLLLGLLVWHGHAAAVDLVMAGHRIALSGTQSDALVDLISGSVTVHVQANQGVKGDGWCPPDQVGAKGITAPWVELRLPNLSTHRISLNGAATQLLSNGDVQVTPLSAGGLQGDGWCPPDITWPTPLRAEPAMVMAGQSTQLIWASAGAQSCHPDGSTYPQGVTSVTGWTGTLPTQTAGRAVTPTAPGAYVFRLNCVSSTGATFTQSVPVSVTAADICAGPHQPPVGLTRATAFVNVFGLRAIGNQEWASNATLDLTMWNPPKPGQLTTGGINRSVIGNFARAGGDTAAVSMAQNGYLAMKIETAGILPLAAGSVLTEQPGQNAAPSVMSISRCPGDFAPTDSRCLSTWSGVGGIGMDVRYDAGELVPDDSGRRLLPQHDVVPAWAADQRLHPVRVLVAGFPILRRELSAELSV
ncbi:MAG: hypothetical protein IPK97_06270 [Ahniella sp.]|nr:hypothetical protein [Ahniella sp.]